VQPHTAALRIQVAADQKGHRTLPLIFQKDAHSCQDDKGLRELKEYIVTPCPYQKKHRATTRSYRYCMSVRFSELTFERRASCHKKLTFALQTGRRLVLHSQASVWKRASIRQLCASKCDAGRRRLLTKKSRSPPTARRAQAQTPETLINPEQTLSVVGPKIVVRLHGSMSAAT
jgi:hypothetical protein